MNQDTFESLDKILSDDIFILGMIKPYTRINSDQNFNQFMLDDDIDLLRGSTPEISVNNGE